MLELDVQRLTFINNFPLKTFLEHRRAVQIPNKFTKYKLFPLFCEIECKDLLKNTDNTRFLLKTLYREPFVFENNGFVEDRPFIPFVTVNLFSTKPFLMNLEIEKRLRPNS